MKPGTLSRIISGKRPKSARIPDLAAYLGVNVEEFYAPIREKEAAYGELAVVESNRRSVEAEGPEPSANA